MKYVAPVAELVSLETVSVLMASLEAPEETTVACTTMRECEYETDEA